MTQPKYPTKVTIYTDGGTNPNPGPGGWGAILLYEDKNGKHERELKGRENKTTNNRMEITAMLEGLKALKRPVNVIVYTDSKYLKDSIGNWDNGKSCQPFGWVIGWEAQGWAKRKGPLKNVDLWKALIKECKKQKSITVRWVRGHSGNLYNERCDELATKAMLEIDWDWKTVEESIMDTD